MQERAHAKVNLVLSVTPGVCEGAYHEVRTVMCALELHDEVELRELAAGEGLVFSCDPDPLPAGADPATNLAYRAAVGMAEAFEKPLDMSVTLRKHVPSQAGLGGGSSDAAAVIRGLARMWQIDLEDERVVRLAQSLGADVAFFLHEVPSYLDGRGDVLRETFAPFSVPVVLVKPDQGVSTGACYRLLDEMATPAPQVDPMLEALRACDVPGALAAVANNMEPAALQLAPAIAEVFAFLQDSGTCQAGPLLCGSGSCVCAFLDDPDVAECLAAQACEHGWWACASATLA